MPTDDERREVARRLRERAGKRVLNLGELFWCIGCDEGDDAAAWNRLADLIDPQTSEQTNHDESSLSASPIDRGALLELAEEMERGAKESEAYFANVGPWDVIDYARRIREACGVVE